MTGSDRVVIVGMGPVGATLALLLGRAGVPTLVLERDATVFAGPRAVALDDEALRILQAAEIRGDGGIPLVVDRALRLSSAARAPLVEISPQRSLHGHPSVAFFHQPDLEAALRAAVARQASVEVLLGHEVLGFGQDRDGIQVRARARHTGAMCDFRGRWLIGCDGPHGAARRGAGIRLRGFTSRRRWLVVDTRGGCPAAAAPFEFICDPDRPTVSVPLPGGTHRWEFMLKPGEDGESLRRPEVARTFVAHWSDPATVEVLRASVYRFHARVAERFADGRVLLAGDAAHLSPPFAGLGLSSGLRDAHNLAWKLTAVHSGASADLMASYERERRPDAIRLVARAVAIGMLVQTTRRPVATARDGALRTVATRRSVQRWIAAGRWRPHARYRSGFVIARPRRRHGEGSAFPQPTVRTRGVESELLDDLLGTGFSVVGWRTDPWTALGAESRTALEAVNARMFLADTHLQPVRTPSAVVADGDGVLERWFSAAGAPLALMRPDHYVYAVFESAEAPSVMREFSRALGLHREASGPAAGRVALR